MSDPRPLYELDQANYDCKFKGTETNGHWHTTPLKAKECVEAWSKWNNPKPTKQYSFSNKPQGTSAPDKNFNQ